MLQLDQLKAFVADKERYNFDELIVVSAECNQLVQEYEKLNAKPPEWLTDAKAAIGREIRARQHDQLSKRLRQNKAKLEGLMTADEKRAALIKENEDLEKQLAQSV